MQSPPNLSHLIRTADLIRGALLLPMLLCLGAACGDFPDDGRADAAIEAQRDPANPAVWVGGGSFRSGSDDWNDDDLPGSPFSKEDEIPGAWTVEGFWIQQHEVTNEEYARFDPNHAFPRGQENRPVANVTWEEAMAYARALGGSLPSEVHWEFAARGPERRSYPWGNDQPTCARAHFRDCQPPSTIDVTTRAGDMTPDGIYDLAGNVREWVAPVWFDRARHPVNHETRRIKGGSFSHPAFFLRSAAVSRHLEFEESWESVGFRVSWETVASRR